MYLSCREGNKHRSTRLSILDQPCHHRYVQEITEASVSVFIDYEVLTAFMEGVSEEETLQTMFCRLFDTEARITEF